MLLIAEIIIIFVLVIALISLIIEEEKIKKSKVPRGIVKEYWSGQERRQYLRINTSLTVRYNVEKKFDVKLNGHIKDVSSDGMRLLINEKLANGALLLLEFELPDIKGAISAEGKVIWADGEFNERDEIGRRVFNTGIQFLNIRSEDRSRLVAYIKKIAKKIDEREKKI